MKYNFLKSILLLAITSIVAASCIKNKVEPLGDRGTTFAKLLGGGSDPMVLPLDVLPTIENIDILDVRKDAKDNAELNLATTITLTNTQEFLDEYNNEHGTAFELLPEDAYTISAKSGVSVNANTWTINLAPGEFARTISISVDKDKLDLSLSYAFGIKITSTSTGSVSAVGSTQIVNILIKNGFDGAYEVTGSMTDAANSALVGVFPMNYHLVTTGEKSVIGYDNDIWGGNVVPILSAGSDSYYGSFVPIFTFDGDNNVVSVTNGYGQPSGNGRYAELDPSGINKFDPDTKNIDVKFFMFQPSVIPLPNPRVSFEWHMKYIGPR